MTCDSAYDGYDEEDSCMCIKTKGHNGSHVCCCDQRWNDSEAE